MAAGRAAFPFRGNRSHPYDQGRDGSPQNRFHGGARYGSHRSETSSGPRPVRSKIPIDPRSPASPRRGEPLFGWILVAAGTAIIVIINGTFYSYGVFFKPLLLDFGWARAELSGPVSLRLLATGVFGIIAGAIVDRGGPRWVVSGGIALLATGYLLTARMTSLWELYLYLGLISGIGMGVPYPVITSVVSRWFTRKRGLAVGIILAGYGIGQVIFPPLTAYLIAAFSSWRTAFVVLGLIVAGVAIPLGFVLKRPPAAAAATAASPGGKSDAAAAKEDRWSFKDSLKTQPLWQIGALYLLFSICLQAIMVHLVPHAIDMGIDPLAASILLTIVGGANAIGRIAGGGLSDRIGTKRTMIISIVLPGLMIPSLIFANSLFWLYAIAAVYGVGYGGLSSTVPKLTSEYYGLHSLGALLGIIQLTFAVGGAIGAPLTGAVYDRTGSYTLAFILLTAFLAMAFVICLGIKPPERMRRF
ncbi:MAG: MFS transporter [Chloroflexi bacterium]|nr:MFS transporter [Chloroflexota bacterium]